MKKYSIVISLFAMLLTACDPTVEEEGSIAASMTEAQLEQAATLMQTVEGQNKFTYATNPSTTVQILDPSGNILTTGTSGSFDLTPGGEESQTFTIRTINQDGSITSFQKTFSITTYVDVDPAWAYLCGDGEKVWTYDSEVLEAVGVTLVIKPLLTQKTSLRTRTASGGLAHPQILPDN